MLISAMYGFTGNKEWVFRQFIALVFFGIYSIVTEVQKLNKNDNRLS